MKDKQTQTSGGIGFVGLLTIVFVVAKIWGYLDWSWWWVFSPLIAIVALFLLLLFAYVMFFVILEDFLKP